MHVELAPPEKRCCHLSFPSLGMFEVLGCFIPFLRFSYRIIQVRASFFFFSMRFPEYLLEERTLLTGTQEISRSCRDPRCHLDPESKGVLRSRLSPHMAATSPRRRVPEVLIPASPAHSAIFAKPLNPSALPCANQRLPVSPWLLHGREAESREDAGLALRTTGPFFPTVCYRFL